MAVLVGALLAVNVTLGPVWDQSGQRPVELELSAGSVAPGRAEVELRGDASRRLRHSVSFEMPAEGAAHLRLWLDPLSGINPSSKLQIAVRPHAGPELRRPVELDPVVRTQRSDSLFEGTSTDLGVFDRALHEVAAPSEASGMLATLGIVEKDALAARRCRSLADSAMVVVRSAETKPLERDLLECAARGARVLFVGSPPPPVAGLEPGRAWSFGRGHVAHAPDFGRAAASAALDLRGVGAPAGMPNPTSYADQLLAISRYTHDGHPIPGRGAILGVLAAYVALIGPVGWFVALRRRKTLVQWLWFPCVACVTAAAFALVGSSSYVESARLTLSHVTVESPGYGGLVRGGVRLSGLDAQTCTVSLPWRDADLTEVARPYRFGSPFRPPAGGMELAEDTQAGRLDAKGLVVERYGQASLGYVAPVASAPTLRVERVVSRGLRVTNPTNLTFARTLLIVESGAWADVGRLAPGESREVSPSTANQLPKEPDWRERDYRAQLQFSPLRESVPAGHFLLAADVEKPRANGVRSMPELTVYFEDVRFVFGPIVGVPE